MWVSMSWMSWWLIDPKALARLRKVMYEEHCILLAISIMQSSLIDRQASNLKGSWMEIITLKPSVRL